MVVERVEDIARRLKERLTEAAQRLPSAGLPLFERYCRGDLQIHVHMLGGINHPDGGDRCILIQRTDPFHLHSMEMSPPGSVGEVMADVLKSHDAKREMPVLVYADEPIEEPEGMRGGITPIPSFIRLRALHDCHCVGGDASRDSERDGLAAPLGARFFDFDRKGCVFVRFPIVCQYEVPGQVIEGRPQVGEEITEEETRSHRELAGDRARRPQTVGNRPESLLEGGAPGGPSDRAYVP